MGHYQRLVAVAALAILLTACGSQQTATTKGTSQAAGTTLASTPAGAATSALACKIPIFYPAESGTVQGGWTTMPGGQTQADSNGAFARSGNVVTSKVQPALRGDGPTFYDRARSRWLPVGQNGVSDDGSTYVYVDPDQAQTLHVVTVSSGQDHVVKLPATQTFERWNVLQYTGGRVYLIRQGSEGPGTPGLWQLDPSSGQVTTVFGDRTPVAVQGKAAWFETVNPSDSHALTNAQSGDKLPDQLERRPLPSGPPAVWVYKPGSALQFVGSDNEGHPFVAVSHGESADQPIELDIATGPGTATPAFHGTVADVDALSVNFTDQHGTWFGSNRGLYLYPKSGMLVQVSNTGARPAGRCA